MKPEGSSIAPSALVMSTLDLQGTGVANILAAARGKAILRGPRAKPSAGRCGRHCSGRTYKASARRRCSVSVCT